MKENINELLEEINDQELEGAVVGGIVLNECNIIHDASDRSPRPCVKK